MVTATGGYAVAIVRAAVTDGSIQGKLDLSSIGEEHHLGDQGFEPSS
jgi:hypothetical protein